MNNSTSEVGFDPHMQEMFQKLLETQNQNLLSMVRMLREPDTTTRKKMFFPKFDSDDDEADADAWVAMVELMVVENPLEGATLISALSHALKGSAAQWLTQVCFPSMTWIQFKDLFLQRFGEKETSAACVMKWLNSQPKSGESISAYGNRLMNALETKWRHMNAEEIAVSVALAHMATVDKKLQHKICTTEIRTRADFQREVKAYSFVDKDEPNAKKIKYSTPQKCHFCGKEGHKIAFCRSRTKLRIENRPRSDDLTTNIKKNNIICFKCGVAGHIASKCTMSTGNQVKRVDVCQVVNPKGNLLHSGESFEYYFDSGAECSLIKESKIGNFAGKRIHSVVMLKGIGNGIVYSTLQFLTDVTINDLTLEILFHVVGDDCLKYNIIIGRDILSMGFGVATTFKDFNLFKLKSINCCSVKTQINFENLNTDLAGAERLTLINILQKYAKWFIDGIPKTRVSTGQLEIRLIDVNKTVQRRPYRMSSEERAIVREKIKELMEANIIQPSNSPFASPILLVKKKNGTDRLCVDYRELNTNTVSDKFPLPLISDQIARLKGSTYFSCLDMASGFHQIPIHPNSVERTAFVTPDGQFEFLTMPFGLKNAPSVFQRAINKALGDLAYSYVIVYMDDIMVVASSKQEALERLDNVLNTLCKAGFSLNFDKCHFLKTKVEYLGYEVSAGQIRPNSRKILALTSLPPPQSITQLRQFIGLASYFRQFVPKFSQIMKPLYLLTSNKTLEWKPEHEKIRTHIISVLTEHPVLVIFDPKYETELHTDASSEGYGAILLHKIDNKPHPIEYYSRTTSSAESRYHSYELEILAIVNAIKHFRHYLQGIRFTVFTDCNSIKSSRTKKELTPRAQRWWAYLQHFDFDVEYREGKRMAHVDFLSRNPVKIVDKIEQKHINLTEITNDWLLAEQERDVEISLIIDKIKNNELVDTYELRNGILHRKIQRMGKTKCLPVVPTALKWSVVNHVHDSIMHLGWQKTLDKIYNYYWFEKMSKYVRKFVDNCMTCKLSKSNSGKVQAELHPIPKVNIPWHTVHIDITGKLSGKSDLKEYIIVQIDAFTKFVFLHHTVNIDTESCIKSVKSSISLLGLPTRIIADQGRCFASKNFRSFCSSQNIDLHLIATGACRANGQVERVMSTLKNMLTIVETSHRSWQDALGEIQLAMNSTSNRVTQFSPLEMLIGKEVRPFGLLAVNENEDKIDRFKERDLASQNMNKAASYDKERFDKNKASIVRHKLGDFVLLKNEERHQTKLDPKFKGPFKIIRVLEGDRYEIKSLNSNRTYKYAHEFLRKMPACILNEEICLKSKKNQCGDQIIDKSVANIRENVDENGEKLSDISIANIRENVDENGEKVSDMSIANIRENVDENGEKIPDMSIANIEENVDESGESIREREEVEDNAVTS